MENEPPVPGFVFLASFGEERCIRESLISSIDNPANPFSGLLTVYSLVVLIASPC
jgi:hypothetical protein